MSAPTTTILQGHCLEQMATLPAGSVQMCCTSPPYWGLRNYGIPPVRWPEVTFSPMAGLPPITVPTQEAVHGLEPDLWAYIGHEVSVFREVRRTLREDGVLFVNLGDSYCSTAPGTMGDALRQSGIFSGVLDATAEARRKYRPDNPSGLKPKDLIGIPWRVALALQADGWWLRSDIIWHKPNPMPESVTDRPTRSHEYIFLMTKSQRYFYDAEAVKEAQSETTIDRFKSGVARKQSRKHIGTNGECLAGHETSKAIIGSRNKRTVWTIPSAPYREAHFATFPPDLIKPCILAGTSAKGCCPKCGANWERIVVKGEPDLEHQRACGGDANGQYFGQSTKDYAAAKAQNASAIKARILAGMVERKTISWQPTCECHGRLEIVEVIIPPSDKSSWKGSKFDDGKNATTKPNQGEHSEEPKVKLVRVYHSDLPLDQHPIQPCTVLDPFLGSATTAQVALELGRSAIGCELNPDYITLGNNRTNVTPGLNLA